MKPKTAEEALAVIRDFISEADGKQGYKEVTKFWNIITALRGPDYVEVEAGEEGKIKAATTEVIRQVAIGRYNCFFVGALSSKDTIEKAKRRGLFGTTDDHFWIHAKLAFEALGLKWSERNK